MFTYIDNPPEFTDVSTTTIKGGRWYITPNGTYPSVTTVLGHKEKPWLKDWQNMLGPKKAKKEQERCSERGEAVHEMCELFLQNVDLETIKLQRARDHVALFNQIKLALQRRINNIRAQEVALWSDELTLAGRVDCVAEYDGTLSIIDFKSSTSMKDETMIEDYFLQCTAYALMYTELYGEHIEDIVVIIASEKGFMPAVFKKKIDDYILPLYTRIDEFAQSI
jgi:genome maintenance exonuclease 1